MRLSALALLLAACATPADDIGQIEQTLGATAERFPTEPGRVIHYAIDLDGKVAYSLPTGQPRCGGAVPDTTLDPSVVPIIDAAMASFQGRTPLNFVKLDTLPATYPGYPVLVFTRWTSEGAHGDGAPSATDPNNWLSCVYLPTDPFDARVIQHETGHNLGMLHEQNRSDAAIYVSVDLTCEDHPEAYSSAPGSRNLTPFDFDSVMIYSSKPPAPGCPYTMLRASSGCDNWDPTCNCPSGDACRLIAHTTDLSRHDINALFRMYEPTLDAAAPLDGFGAAMAAGDFDGDGYDDLAVGAPGENLGAGAVFLYKGTEGGLVAWKLLSPDATAEEFGWALVAADLDGDGLAELAVGAPGSHADAGAFYVYPGSATGPTSGTRYSVGTSTATSFADAANDRFGESLAVGKIDGVSLYVVAGAPGRVRDGKAAGMVFLFRADDPTALDYRWAIHATMVSAYTAHDGDRFGAALALADWNGDGDDDLAVGVPQDTVAGAAGAVFLYQHNATGTFGSVKRLEDAAPVAGGRFGAALAVGDFRDEGLRRLVVGAPGKQTGRGKAFVYRPVATTTAYDFPDRQLLDESLVPGLALNDNDNFGEVFAVTDLDGDGADDLLVGIPHEDIVHGTTTSVDEGAVAFFRGHAAAPLTGWGVRFQHADPFTIAPGDRFGSAVAAGLFGDRFQDLAAANDALPDLAIGASGRIGGAGTMQFLFGDGNLPDFKAAFDEGTATPE